MTLRTVLLVGCLLAAVAALAADEPPPEFQAELIEGRTLVGRLVTISVCLQNEFGTQDIEARHIRRITFRPLDSENGRDVIELDDKSRAHGQLVTERFEFQVGDSVEAISRTALREIKTINQKSPGWVALMVGLFTLAAMEIVLGIDNIIFLAIVAGKLPPEKQPRARRLGLIAALGTRIVLLCSLSFLLGLTKPVFTIPEIPYLHDLEAREISLRDLILLAGGLFLIGKSVREIHEKLEAAKEDGGDDSRPVKAASFGGVLIQIAILDIVFSLDSVITAIGMVDVVWVMITAMVIAMLVMMAFAGSVSEFVARRPTIKILALSFLILIGVMLVAESLGQHIDKGYIYFAMAFAVGIEMVNLRLHKKVQVPPAGKC